MGAISYNTFRHWAGSVLVVVLASETASCLSVCSLHVSPHPHPPVSAWVLAGYSEDAAFRPRPKDISSRGSVNW